MAKVTGIGGIFFKCQDPEKVRNWYAGHLGIDVSPYGAKVPAAQEYVLWTPFAESTKYFEPSPRDFMINYRVDDLDALAAKLNEAGVTLLDEVTDSDFGKFLHILDCEGNKIELWQPK